MKEVVTDTEPETRYIPGTRQARLSLQGDSSLVEDWSQCVKRITASSREGSVMRLFDGSCSYWQSCGTQGKVLNHHTKSSPSLG